jgi:hypothetical protein
MKFYIVYGPMKTGTTTLFNRIASAVPDPVFHTHEMEIVSVLNKTTELESRVFSKRPRMKGCNAVFEGKAVYRIHCQEGYNICDLFNPDDEVFIISTVRNPINQKISHILHQLNLMNVNTILNADINNKVDIKERIYQYIGCLMFEKVYQHNIFLQHVYNTKAFLSSQDVINLWSSKTKIKCDHEYSFKFLQNNILRSTINLSNIKDQGYTIENQKNRDGVFYNVMILKTECIDSCNNIINDFIRRPIHYKGKHRDKHDTNAMYVCKDDIHTVIKTLRDHAMNDPSIKTLYQMDCITQLGYSLNG